MKPEREKERLGIVRKKDIQSHRNLPGLVWQLVFEDRGSAVYTVKVDNKDSIIPFKRGRTRCALCQQSSLQQY